MSRYRIQFPKADSKFKDQDEAGFKLITENEVTELRFHDYAEIYKRQGLYEQLFYDRLKCTSPKVVGDILKKSLDANGENFTEMRVLDLGAGNGMMGDVLKACGVARLVGSDIIPEAREACFRDRPHLYDDYFISDFTNLSKEEKEEIGSWSFDCLTSVAALGFGDIPPEAFFQGVQFIQQGGWLAFNIKESFLDNTDNTGFSRLIRELIFSEYLVLHHLLRYKHRLSIEGVPIYYFAMVARKTKEIPGDFLEEHNI